MLSLQEWKKNFILYILFYKKQRFKIAGNLNLLQLLPNWKIGINKLEFSKGGKGETCAPMQYINTLLVCLQLGLRPLIFGYKFGINFDGNFCGKFSHKFKCDAVDDREKEQYIVVSQMWKREERTITAYVIIHRNKEWNKSRDLAGPRNTV